MVKNYHDDRAMLLGLLIDCPFGISLGSCPLDDLRSRLTLQEKIDYSESLASEEVKTLLTYHAQCLRRREM